MKIGVICNLNDNVEIHAVDENDKLLPLDLVYTALSSQRKLMIVNVDNSGVTIDREYPKAEESKTEARGAGGAAGAGGDRRTKE